MIRTYKDITYTLRQSKRKTASIYIERDGQISIFVPETLSDNQINNLIESKRRWIYRSLAEWQDLNATRVQRKYVNGEGFLYLGRSYRLKLVAEQSAPLMLKDGYFCLRANNGSILDADATFREFYRQRGRQRICERVAFFQSRMGVYPKTVRVIDIQNRWASCTPKGNLNFHWKCIMAPPTILDYIIVHELAHLVHRNHTEAFWHEVDKAMPNYRERKLWLRVHGAEMDL